MSDLVQGFSFASGANAAYIDQLYSEYKADPNAVEETFRRFFEGYDFAVANGVSVDSIQSPEGNASGQSQENYDARVEAYINAFRKLGHLSSDINPLEDAPHLSERMLPAAHGLKNIKDDQSCHPANLPLSGHVSFKQVFDLLTETYCGKIGPDFRDIDDIDAVIWLQERMETVRNKPNFDAETKKMILSGLIKAEGFERFLQDRYIGQKRFSLEGLDALIPLMDMLHDKAAELGVEEVNIGMAHRGRLNVLANILGKDYRLILKEFEGGEIRSSTIDGDVKYHMGFANCIKTHSGRDLNLYLSPNPSHLEIVGPVVEGFARCRQRTDYGENFDKVLPVLMHGDAAFIGQGVVAETLNLSCLEKYSTGGTIHIVTNNQIGFTTDPDDSRSGPYASEIAKIIKAPVFHVNADDPEAAVWSAVLAMEFRQKFKRDVVIDLIGYRKHGHNEGDEPNFTQPQMYKKIKKHPRCLTQYMTLLDEKKIVSKADSAGQLKEFRAKLQSHMEEVRAEGSVSVPSCIPDRLAHTMNHEPVDYEEFARAADTNVSITDLKEIVSEVTSIPEGFTANPKVKRLFETRSKMISGEGAFDWGMSELAAYASLSCEGHHVRMSGQDCRRGTFSHRHAVINDFETGKPYEILNNLSNGKSTVDIINSPLSEAGVMGFEFGYSVADPNALVIWEAQFGDFANGAQIIIDQFLVASEAKWRQSCGLVLLLPHGYEGQGPEHSNARPERFLQLCGGLNIQVCTPTTPAQNFHLLRRQVKRSFRKPLVVMSPKSLLRHPAAVSKTEEFTSGKFEEVIDDHTITKKDKVERIVFCTGKIYYELIAGRDVEKQRDCVAIVRVEQMYPFPSEKLKEIKDLYKNCKEFVWCQEEPVNMGAWTFARPRMIEALGLDHIRYVGRVGSGTTAEGSKKSHDIEQERIVKDAVGLACPVPSKEITVSH